MCLSQTHTNKKKNWVSPRHTWVSPRHTWVSPRHTWVDPRHTWVDPRHTWVSPRHTWVDPRHTCVSPRHTFRGKKSKNTKQMTDSMKLTFSGPFSTSISPFDSEFHSGCRKNIKSFIAIDFYIQINDLFSDFFFCKQNIESGYKIDTPKWGVKWLNGGTSEHAQKGNGETKGGRAF